MPDPLSLDVAAPECREPAAPFEPAASCENAGPVGAGAERLPAPPLHVEMVDGRTLLSHQVAWADLAERSLDRNVFLEPGFALPLLQHVAVTDRPRFVLVWEENGPASFGRLLGLLPLRSARGFFGNAVLRGFHHKQMALGVPLIDRERRIEALDAVLTWLGARDPNAAAVRLPGVPTDSAFHALAIARAAAAGVEARGLARHRRAILRRKEQSASSNVVGFVSAKKRKELRRQHRRLSECGARTYASACAPAAISLATERFLALEHDGWKGARGTALLADPSLATFTRTMTRLMAAEGRCRIDSIEIDGRPVAMGIIIRAGDRAHFWKTAFDEAHASLSPGVQFALALTEAQLADPDVAITDSCAAPDHPMIDKLWSDRLEIEDLLIGLRATEPRRFERVYRLERLAHSLLVKARALRRWWRRP